MGTVMTEWSADFVPFEEQLFRPRIGEVIANLLRGRFRRDTAKTLERRYDLEPSTAKNVLRGHVSERSLTSILQGEGEDVFELLDAIGHALTGKSRDEWEEQKLQRIIDEANNAQARIARIGERRRLAERASFLDPHDVLASDPEHKPAGGRLRL